MFIFEYRPPCFLILPWLHFKYERSFSHQRFIQHHGDTQTILWTGYFLIKSNVSFAATDKVLMLVTGGVEKRSRAAKVAAIVIGVILSAVLLVAAIALTVTELKKRKENRNEPEFEAQPPGGAFWEHPSGERACVLSFDLWKSLNMKVLWRSIQFCDYGQQASCCPEFSYLEISEL